MGQIFSNARQNRAHIDADQSDWTCGRDSVAFACKRKHFRRQCKVEVFDDHQVIPSIAAKSENFGAGIQVAAADQKVPGGFTVQDVPVIERDQSWHNRQMRLAEIANPVADDKRSRVKRFAVWLLFSRQKLRAIRADYKPRKGIADWDAFRCCTRPHQ